MLQSFTKILVCGSGNGAHVTAGLAASCKNTESCVFTLSEDKAKSWNSLLKENDFVVKVTGKDGTETEIKASPSIVSSNPASVVPGSNLIVLVIPAFVHQSYLKAIEPYLEPNTAIVGMPGQPGFEFQCFGILKDKARSCTILSFETLPWVTRIVEFGKKVNILGTKEHLLGSIISSKSNPPPFDPLQTMQKVLGNDIVLKKANNFLETYMSTKSIINPPIMYGKWKDWDGRPLVKAPLFFQGVDETATKYLSGIADELMATAKAFQNKNSKFSMSNVIHLTDWYRETYPDRIKDKRNLMTCLQTNEAYNGLNHPMTEKNGQFVPNFGHRFLVEDVPNGLVAIKGLSLIAGVETPFIDEVIVWSQSIIHKEYLVDGQLKGKDLKETRCPQCYGYNSIDDLISLL